MLVMFVQELLRTIHDELRLERITGKNAMRHSEQEGGRFARPQRVNTLLTHMEDRTDLDRWFVKPYRINMENLRELVEFMHEWLAVATDPHSRYNRRLVLQGGLGILNTPLKINMEPINEGLEDDFPFSTNR